jgi:hypothetical protein
MTDNTMSPPIREHGEGVREILARLVLKHMFGFEYEGESLCDEADRIFVSPNPRCTKAVAIADDILAALSAQPVKDAVLEAATDALILSHAGFRCAAEEALALIDEINERKPSRVFNGINGPLHAKLCTIRATLARALSPKSPASVGLDPETIERCPPGYCFRGVLGECKPGCRP